LVAVGAWPSKRKEAYSAELKGMTTKKHSLETSPVSRRYCWVLISHEKNAQRWPYPAAEYWKFGVLEVVFCGLSLDQEGISVAHPLTVLFSFKFRVLCPPKLLVLFSVKFLLLSVLILFLFSFKFLFLFPSKLLVLFSFKLLFLSGLISFLFWFKFLDLFPSKPLLLFSFKLLFLSGLILFLCSFKFLHLLLVLIFVFVFVVTTISCTPPRQ
jgi:hypothetical protein